MPIQPKASFLKIICKSCGWSITIRLRSDAFASPGTCASCGSEKLSHSFAGHLESLLSSPLGYICAVLKGIA